MGKRVKKSRTLQKENRVSADAPVEESKPTSEAPEAVARDRKACSHLSKGVDLNALSGKIVSLGSVRCESCREGAADRRGGVKVKNGKAGKKKGGGLSDSKFESRAVWVCLACGHFSCGGVGLPTSRQCHALRHARQTRHPIVVQYEKPQLRWCFPCNALIQPEKVEGNGEEKDVFSEALKLIKRDSLGGSAVNVEEVHLGTGSATAEMKSVVAASSDLSGRGGGYVARGLSNLGNTCFFNSVLQNLLAMDRVRDYFLNLDVTTEPLTTALKKLYNETQQEAGSKNVINPKAFFGCVCLKAPQFIGYEQHDTHELLRCLLDGWSSEELGTRKQMNSSKENGGTSPSPIPTFVDFEFGGQVSSTVCCVECGNSSTVYEPFLDLSLPVPTKTKSKKTQQSACLKNPKLPPKRVVKNRPKLIIPGSDASKSKELPCESLLSSTSTVRQSEENSSASQDSPAVEVSQNKEVAVESVAQISSQVSPAVEVSQTKEATVDSVAQISFPSDSVEWIDYLDPEPQAQPVDFDLAENGIDDSVPQDTKAENNSLVNDAPLTSTTESEDNNTLVNDVSLKSISESEDRNRLENFVPSESVSELEDKQPLENVVPLKTVTESNGKNKFVDDVPVKTGTEAGIQVSPINENPDTQHQFSSVNPWEDEIPLQVQSNEVILLPYKEERSYSGFEEGGSSSAIQHGSGQEDVEGFGGMFDEPEVSTGHVAGPSISNNNSESDPDEVDDSNSPVSVETCLVHYTKPELLSDENAWHCENCSKTLLCQKLEASKHLKSEATVSSNGCGTGAQGEIARVNILSDNIQVKETGQIDEPSSFVSQDEEGDAEIKNGVQDQANSLRSYSNCGEESLLSDQATDSDCVDKECESNVLTTNCEPKERKDDEGIFNSVKVKRTATKRVLINKAPLMLTIHLKRFSQDGRGRLSKLKGHVTFKETLDLTPYMEARCVDGKRYDYRLIGAIEHQGTMRGGHYVSYVRGKTGKGDDRGSVWFHASDANVRETNLEEVLRCEAYILFYEKV